MLIVVMVVMAFFFGLLFISVLTGEVTEIVILLLSMKTGFMTATLLGCLITGTVSMIRNIRWVKKIATETKLTFDEAAVYVVHSPVVRTFDDSEF